MTIDDVLFVVALISILLTQAAVWAKEQQGRHWQISVEFVNMLMVRLQAVEAKCALLERENKLRLTGESNFMDFSDGLSLNWNVRTGVVKLRDDRIQKGPFIFEMDDAHWEAIMFDHAVTFALAHQPEWSLVSLRHKKRIFYPDEFCTMQIGNNESGVTVRDMVKAFADNKDMATNLRTIKDSMRTYFGLHRQQGNKGIQFCMLLIDEDLTGPDDQHL